MGKQLEDDNDRVLPTWVLDQGGHGAGIYPLSTLVLEEARGESPRPSPPHGDFCHQNRKLPLSSECGRKGSVLMLCWSGPKPYWGEKPVARGDLGEFPTGCLCPCLGAGGGDRAEPPRMAPLPCFLPAPAQVDMQEGRGLPAYPPSVCPSLLTHPPMQSAPRAGQGDPKIKRPGLAISLFELHFSARPEAPLTTCHPRQIDTCKISHMDMEPQRCSWSDPQTLHGGQLFPRDCSQSPSWLEIVIHPPPPSPPPWGQGPMLRHSWALPSAFQV